MPSSLRQLFLSHIAQTSDAPLALEITRSKGMYLYDAEGKAYMDLIAGIGVSSLGHRHPKVLDAIQDQLDHYLHTMVYGEYVLSPQVRLAEKLIQHLPELLDSVYLVNSGTEATEGAMKLAKRYTGRSEIISAYRSYHGSTQGAASLMSDPYFTQAYRPLLPGIRHIDFNCMQCLEKITDKTAAVIVETVQAEWGIRKPTPDFIQALRARCSEVGALLILDEIQAGCGRTGSLFAFEQYGIEPDILLLAKGLGGGMPIGAFIAHREVMEVLTNQPVLGHITTFGGHPVSSAAALATLNVLTETDLIEQVAPKRDLFLNQLTHEAILDLREAGLWMAVELEDEKMVQQVIQQCLKAGLVTDWFLFNPRCLRIAPPLIISEAEIEKGCSILLEAMDTLY